MMSNEDVNRIREGDDETRLSTERTTIARIFICKQPECEMTDGQATDKLSEDGIRTATSISSKLREENIVKAASCNTRRGQSALAIILDGREEPITIVVDPILDPVPKEMQGKTYLDYMDAKKTALIAYFQKLVAEALEHRREFGALVKPRCQFLITHSHIVEAGLEALIEPKSVLSDAHTEVGIFNPGQYWVLEVAVSLDDPRPHFTLVHKNKNFALTAGAKQKLTPPDLLS